jgi:hypothetical protein
MYSGQRISPPGLSETSPVLMARCTEGSAVQAMNTHSGMRKTLMPMTSTHTCTRRESLLNRTSMRTCWSCRKT